MDSFEILGISSTNDVKQIRKAYSKLLPQFSPENDSDGFQRLRAAYEDALLKARTQGETPEKILSPIDAFMKTFEANYNCFERRIDITTWEEIIEKDICYNIDSSKEVSNRILSFITNAYNFKSEVWVLFNSHFSWTAKKDILYNSFPKGFIDFIVFKINIKSTFDYDYLKHCKDNKQDIFIENYRNLDNAINQFDIYTASNCINAEQEICPDHPDLQILIGRYFSIVGKKDDALDLFSSLISSNKEDADAFSSRAELYYSIGKLEEAYKDYKIVLTLKPSFDGLWYALAKCCICLGKYNEAIEYSTKLIEFDEYRQDFQKILTSSCNFYIDTILKNNNIKQAQMDNNTKFKLAECYFKISKIEESYNILNELVLSPECTSSMYYLFCRVIIVQKNIQLAYTNVCKALDLFKHDYELNLLKADILDDLGRYEESIRQYDIAIVYKKNQFSSYNNKSFVLNKINRYNDALECASKAITLNPEASKGYKNKAAALLGLKLYEDCLVACEQALSKYQYLTEVYIIKMKAFIEMNLLDQALDVYNKMRDWGVKDSNLYYQKSRVLITIQKYEEAIEYSDLAIELEDNNADFYYVKGLCCYYLEKNRLAIDCFDSTIKYDKNYAAAYYYKIKCLISKSKDKMALAVINDAINLKLQYLPKFHDLKGSILEHSRKYEEAILEYKTAILYSPEACYYYSVAHAYSDLGKEIQAIEYYSKYIELEPNKVEGYVNISYSFYSIGKYNECIECCDKAININPEYVMAYQNKGWALYKLNNIDRAEVECNIALKLDGNEEKLLLLKLRILEFKGLYREALFVCDRMLELNVDSNSIKDIRNELLSKVKNNSRGLFKSLFS